MLKKSFILFSFLFLVFTLSGCAKQGLPYHNYSYYQKHKKQAEKVRDFCNKNYPGWNLQTQVNREQALRNQNCMNANQAVAYNKFISYWKKHSWMLRPPKK